MSKWTVSPATDQQPPQPATRDECQEVMLNKSAHLTALHCPPDWDVYSQLCWPPTPVGHTALLPCPDDGYLNPRHFASRACLATGSWFVNTSFDDTPYTDFQHCLVPHDPSVEDDLKKLVSEQVIFMLKSIDEYNQTYLILRIVSILCLVVSAGMSLLAALKTGQSVSQHKKLGYLALTTAACALLVSGAVPLWVDAVDDATKVVKCRVAKWLVQLSGLVFQEALVGHIFLCLVPVLQLRLPTLAVKTTVALALAFTAVLVSSELLLEILTHPSKFCGFRTMQSSFHWLTTAPRLVLLMVQLSLGSVTVFGVVCLRQPQLEVKGLLYHTRQKAVAGLVMALYGLLLEVLLVLVHAQAYLNYADLPVDSYLLTFSLTLSSQGLVFSLLLCFSHLQLLSELGLTCCSCPPPKSSVVITDQEQLQEIVGPSHRQLYQPVSTNKNRPLE